MFPDILSILFWIRCNGASAFLLLVAAVCLFIAFRFLWNPWRNRIAFIAGYNSIADQLKGVRAEKVIDLQASEPPATWSVVRQVCYRDGQLRALASLEARNAQIQDNLKRGAKRATHSKKRRF